jgi:hypothetical protein
LMLDCFTKLSGTVVADCIRTGLTAYSSTGNDGFVGFDYTRADYAICDGRPTYQEPRRHQYSQMLV